MGQTYCKVFGEVPNAESIIMNAINNTPTTTTDKTNVTAMIQ